MLVYKTSARDNCSSRVATRAGPSKTDETAGRPISAPCLLSHAFKLAYYEARLS